MTPTPFQVIIILFALFALSRAVLRLKDRKLHLVQFAFWAVLWIMVLVFALVPETTGVFARIFGVGRGVDVIIYLGIAFLFYALFRLYIKMDMLETNITKLVREIALWKKKKK
ncbi:DUF2304 family protein [Candidatus Woesearchaeota archaeon]|nr:DUF2304 family protein [Candidatus Woesearchaeota archaeon]